MIPRDLESGGRQLFAAMIVLLAVFAATTVVAVVATTDGGPDRSAFDFVIAHRTNSTIEIAKEVLLLGRVVPLLALAVVCGGGLMLRRVTVALSIVPVVSLVVTGIVVWFVKSVIGRESPSSVMRDVDESWRSFPSGHSALSAATMLAIGLVIVIDTGAGRRTRALVLGACIAVAVAVAVSTVEVHLHWPTDAIGGFALGSLLALVMTWCARSVVAHRPKASLRRPRRVSGPAPGTR